jgi:mannose-6-phosphate isomerase-like protein (cupin superfamily)
LTACKPRGLRKTVKKEARMNSSQIETIVDGLEPIALIIRADFEASGIHFFTPDNFSQQVAYMSHPKDKIISAHTHNLVSRQVLYTQEVLIVRKGSLEVCLYTSKKTFLTSKVLGPGDLILLCGGGHSFKMLKDTSMIEIKQGPYAGENDKTRFEPQGGSHDTSK